MPPVSQTDQLSSGSPPSFGDGKVSDDSSDEYRGHVRFVALPISTPFLLSVYVSVTFVANIGTACSIYCCKLVNYL